MKILFITKDFSPKPGGIAVFLHNLCEQLSLRGHRVDVSAPLILDGEKGKETGANYRTYRYHQWPRLASLPAIGAVVWLFIKNRYDMILIGHVMSASAFGAFVLHKLAGVPYMVLSHGNDLIYSRSTSLDQGIVRIIMDNAELLLANSRFTANRICELGFKGKIEVLNPGVDVKQFNPSVDARQVKEKYGLEGRRVLISVGRLVKRKNIDGVLNALPKIVKVFPNLLYLIVGDGEEKANLERISHESNLGKNVLFVGRLENNLLPAL